MRPAYLPAALSLRSVRRPLFRCGGFRRRQRLFVRPSVRRSRLHPVRRFVAAALSLTPGSPLRCGAPARTRFAASGRRFPAAAKTFCATFGAALSLALGSPPSVFGGALAPLGSPLCGGALAPLGSRPCSKKRPRSFLSTGGFFRIISRAFGKKRVILF